jgi:hypothetical protein
LKGLKEVKGDYIMKQTIQRSISLVGIALFTIGLAMGAPKNERAKTELNVFGRVLKIDRKERTLLISDQSSKKLYLVTVPEGTRLQIFSGICRSYDSPTFENVYKSDVVRVRCIRTDQEHLARLDDGRQMVLLTAAR